MVLIFLLYTNRSLEDERFIENKRCLEWFHKWETQVKSADGIALKEKGKMFLSNKTMFDVCSMIMGFEAYCDILFKMYPGSSVSACYTNQDKLENFFGEQRAHNGATTNPTIMQTGTNHICIFTWLLSVSLYQEISDNLYKDISFAHHRSIWQHFCHICLILEHATLGIVHMQEYKRSKGNCTELRQPSPNC